jgi:hypothetical protein
MHREGPGRTFNVEPLINYHGGRSFTPMQGHCLAHASRHHRGCPRCPGGAGEVRTPWDGFITNFVAEPMVPSWTPSRPPDMALRCMKTDVRAPARGHRAHIVVASGVAFHLLQDCADFVFKRQKSHVHQSAFRRGGCSSTWPYIYSQPLVDLCHPDGWRMEHTVASSL